MVGLEANLRFPGQETMETKIFGDYLHGRIGYFKDQALLEKMER